MIPYTTTPTYVSHVSALVSEKELILSELVSLTGIKGVADKRARLKQRLKTIDKNLADGIAALTWPDVFKVWIETRSDNNGGLWTPDELQLIKQEVTYCEGHTEKALKSRLGLSLQPTYGDIDIKDGANDGDDKYLGDSIGTFRTSKLGTRLYIKCLRELTDEQVTDEMYDGKVSAGKLYRSLPEPVRLKFQTSLAPEVGLACYPSLYLSNDHGFVRVMRSEYALAFRLECITQHDPKYKLRRDYVEAQLLLTASTSQDGTDEAA